jgi:hypothetical protein
VRIAALAALLACVACTDQPEKRAFIVKMAEGVRAGGEVPRYGGTATPELEAELGEAVAAIRASTKIDMRKEVWTAGKKSCAHGKLAGAPGTPTLAVIFDHTSEPWTVWQMSIRRECTCSGKRPGKCGFLKSVAPP